MSPKEQMRAVALLAAVLAIASGKAPRNELSDLLIAFTRFIDGGHLPR